MRMGVGAAEAQRALEREVATEIAQSRIPMSGPGFKIEPVSGWAGPAGWVGRWMLVTQNRDTVICASAAPTYVTEDGFDPEGRRVSRRVAPPLHLQRTRYAPKVVFVDRYDDYLKKVQKDAWEDADAGLADPDGRPTAGLSIENQRLLIVCYGADPKCAAKGCRECRAESGLTPALRRICAGALAEREAERRPKPAPAATAAKKSTKRRAQ